MKTRRLLTILAMAAVISPASAQNNNSSSGRFNKGFGQARKEMYDRYNDFRKKALKDYSEFVRNAWKDYEARPAIEAPQEEEVQPMLAPGADEKTASWFDKLFRRKKKDLHPNAPKKEQQAKVDKPAPKPQPKADKPEPKQQDAVQAATTDRRKAKELSFKEVIKPEPIVKQPEPLAEVKEDASFANDYMKFTVFGTECQVRIGKNCHVRLRSTSADDVADAIEKFQDTQFDNMLYDCLKERKRHGFSDWAYYQMLLALTKKFYGDTNEGTLVRAFLYSQSGYKMRLAHGNNRLCMLTASRHFIYGKKYFYLDDEWYYLLDDSDCDRLSICQASFPKESSLSLQISAVQKFGNNPTAERTITSLKNPDWSFTITSNKNYLDFYETYPSSCVNQNFMTRWAMYANTPIEEGIREQLYPQIQQRLQGLSQKDAVQQLLWWVQTGLEYAYDEDVWGADRAFFGEESLFYPYCDCEDRSILLSHLVRELVHLDCILVYYPGHLAMAVGFTDDVQGDHIMLDGQKFIVCDPTYIGARIGETMPDMRGLDTTVILLQKS